MRRLLLPLVALLLAGTVRAEGVLAAANLVWVGLLALGGVVVAGTQLPSAMRPFVDVLPSAALGDGMRAALVSGRGSPGEWLVLILWALSATLLARRLFRWSD